MLLLALAIVAVGGCKPRSGGTSSSASAGAATSDGADNPKLRELESHLELGADWGNDDTARKVAKHAREALKDQNLARNEVGIAVQMVPGTPRQVVILVKLKDLKEESDHDRKVLLADVRDAVLDDLAPTDRVTLGMRGPFFYGMVASGVATEAWTPTVGKTVDTTPLKKALAGSDTGAK